MTESIRAFFAVPLTPSVRQRLVQIRQELLPDHPTIRPTPIDSLHLTLAFLGDVPSSSLPPLCGAIGEALVPQTRFDLELDRLGAFPTINNPRAYWIGLRGGALPLLFELQRRIVDACDASSVPPSDRRFQPHLTIARTSRRGPRGEAPRPIDVGWDDSDRVIVPVENVTLYRSTLGPSGPSYGVIETWTLANSMT